MPINITTKEYKELGFRILPIGISGMVMVREDINKDIEGKEPKIKKVFKNKNGLNVEFEKAMPKAWTERYGETNNWKTQTDLGGVVCGALRNIEASETEIIALDCDNKAAWDFFDTLNPSYMFKSKSIGKPGGTIFYELCAELREIKQYSVKKGNLDFEFMAKRESGPNSMAYLPTTANKTKSPINLKKAKLEKPNKQVINAILILKPTPVSIQKEFKTSVYMPYNAPLVELYVKLSKENAQKTIYGQVPLESLSKKVYSIFIPKKFRSAKHYVDKGWIELDSPELAEFGSVSTLLVGVSAIAGHDPSISLSLYVDFINVINAHLVRPREPKRLLSEIINPMIKGKSSIKGVPIWRYNKLWDSKSLSIANQYGETLEYLIVEDEPNRFIEYNHTTLQTVEIQSISSLRDQIYSRDTDFEAVVPAKSIVKKLKLIQINDTIKKPVGISVDENGKSTLNSKEPCFALRILREPDKFTSEVNSNNLYARAFNLFLAHLMNEEKASILFMKQLLSYHGSNLSSVPVIIYIVGLGGAGKSIFAEFLEKLFGSNATTRPNSGQVTSRFTDFLEDKALLILSETSDAPKREQEGIKAVLKIVTGEKSIDMETKNKSMRPNIPIFILPLLLSNTPWYNEDDRDRRLFSIIPKEKLDTYKPILEFERQNNLRIREFILEGIHKGYISKYLSNYKLDVLGEVPITKDKLLLASEQDDAVNAVKSLIGNSQWEELFNKFEEYDISSFFTYMELDMPVDKNSIFIGHLIDLCDEMSTNLIGDTRKAIAKRFNALWLPKLHKNFTPARSLPPGIRLSLGYHKWTIKILQAYNDWKVVKMEALNNIGDFPEE